MLIKVENDTLARDTNSNAVLETDVSKLRRYKLFKAEMKKREEKIDDLNIRINKLEELIQRMMDNG